MFISKQPQENISYYKEMLQVIGSLSRLFSESNEPYLYYRVAENLFCKSFGADNLSRSDTSADASLRNTGLGLKTFLRGSGNKLEKIAEFNSDSTTFRSLKPKAQVFEIARLRNERITTTKNIYGLDEMLYHCVVRENGKMSIVEQPMNIIDIESIHDVAVTNTSIRFSDKKEEYSFNISKSTLFKRFDVHDTIDEIPIKILSDPFALLEDLWKKHITSDLVFQTIDITQEHVFLPLYSSRSIKSEKEVAEKSGLNQWNASGRVRSLGEVYIPIPSYIHRKFHDFFPPRDTSFNLHLPDKHVISAKVCQEGGKALMTNPNEALGQWILRDILNLSEGELLTYKKLEDIGLDSVVLYKIDEENYKIDFAKIGSYEAFIRNNPLV